MLRQAVLLLACLGVVPALASPAAAICNTLDVQLLDAGRGEDSRTAAAAFRSARACARSGALPRTVAWFQGRADLSVLMGHARHGGSERPEIALAADASATTKHAGAVPAFREALALSGLFNGSWMASVDGTPAAGGAAPASALVLALPGSEAAGHYSVSMQDTPLRGFMVLAAAASAGVGIAVDAAAAPVWHLVLAPALLDASECERGGAAASDGLTDAHASAARDRSAQRQPHGPAAGWWCPVGAEHRLFPSLAAGHAAVADEVTLAIAQRYATHRLQPPASLLRSLRTRDLHGAAAGAQAAGEARRRVLRRYLAAAAAAAARAQAGASSERMLKPADDGKTADGNHKSAERMLEPAEGRSLALAQLTPRAFGAAAQAAADARSSAHAAAGAQINHDMAHDMAHDADHDMVNDAAAGPAARQAWIAPSYSQGARVILGVRLKFFGQADTVAGLRSEQEISWLLGNSTADLNRASFGATVFSFQMVPGIYTLPSTIAACSSDTTSINTASQSLVAAANPSLTIANFQHFANFLPTCGYAWAGLGQVAGTVTWHNGLSGTSPTDTLVVEHEIGHNMVRAAAPLPMVGRLCASPRCPSRRARTPHGSSLAHICSLTVVLPASSVLSHSPSPAPFSLPPPPLSLSPFRRA